jgi:uncharacterized protein YidB (DUF937 family)
MNRNQKIAIGAAALLAVAGGGVAVAASDDNSPSAESQAIISDAAKQLGVSPAKLSDALKKALADRIDAAVTSGRLTQSEADALKARINSDSFPLLGFGGGRFGHFGFFGSIEAAAGYLGLTDAQLRSELESGKSLAQVAQAHGKSVAGLVDAMVNAAKSKLDDAVSAGRLTQAQESEMLSGLRDRITNLVNATGMDGDHLMRPKLGFRHFWGPPA